MFKKYRFPVSSEQGFVIAGAATGQIFASQVGGIGLVGSFGGMALGTPVIVVGGAIAGAAVQGILEGIETGDVKILGVTTVGSVLGAGVAATVGNMGVGVAGTAFGIGMGTMAATGGLFALGVYQLIKMFVKSESKESAQQVFSRMEDKISAQEFYIQAMLELDPVLKELSLMAKLRELDTEEELQALKKSLQQNLIEDDPQDYQWQVPKNDEELKSLKQTLETCWQNPKTRIQNLYDSQQDSTSNHQLITVQTPQSFWQAQELTHFDLHDLRAIAVSGDDRYFVSGDSRGIIHLWDSQTHKLLFSFISDRAEITSIVISPKNNNLFAAGFHQKISAWHTEKKTIFLGFYALNKNTSHDNIIHALSISPDGNWLASGSSDQKIKLWHTLTGKWERTLNAHQDRVTALAFSQDGKLLISGSADQTVRLWETKHYQNIHTFTEHKQAIADLKWLHPLSILITASQEGTVHFWDTQTYQLLRTLIIGEPIVSLAVNSQTNTLATANHQNIKLWDITTGQLLQTLAGCHPISFSGDGQRLISGHLSKPKTLKIWRSIFSSKDNFESATFSLELGQEWWEILGVDPTTHPQEVKLAYYRLAKQFHPDQNSSVEAVQAMQTINQAYRQFRQQRKKQE